MILRAMRIGIDARFYGAIGKGLGRYTEKLIEYLEKIDEENEYTIYLRRENFADYTPKSARFRKVLADYPWYGFREQLFFPALLKRSRLDLMHFPHFNVPLWYSGPFVVTIHDLILLQYPTLRNTTRSAWLYAVKFLAYRLTIASAIRRARHIFTVSHFTQADIAMHYPLASAKISAAYEAADPFCRYTPPALQREFFSRLGLTSSGIQGGVRGILRPYCLYVGNAYPHKNLDAILRLARAFPDYFFLLVGKEDFFYSRLKKKAEAHALTNVRFVGYISDQELGMLYEQGVLYLFPSLYEGFGLPPLEAMQYGLPVVASRRGSLPEVLGQAAVTFDPEVPRDFERAVEGLLESPERRAEKRALGYRQAASYTWEGMARATFLQYQEVLRNTKKRTRPHE